MAELKIAEEVWHDFVNLARRRRQKADVLAERLLRDFLQREADERLLARSERAAHRAKFRISDSEEIVRRLRRKRKQI